MSPAIPYLACVVGAVAVYVLLRPASASAAAADRAIKVVAIIMGLGAIGWMFVEAGRYLTFTTAPAAGEGEGANPPVMFWMFSFIALASAVRMITHQRPVYCALYFVMIVLSSAGLFLLLAAEFMAFALIIVYAGAILITYMFVLMLAQQAPSAEAAADGGAGGQPEYDRVPREPGMAALVGFVLLALFTHMIFTGVGELEPLGADPLLIAEEMPSANIYLVGMDLVAKFPVSLELAGIILLLAMFGAVVLARKQIELGEDEVRHAAGMRRLGLHADEPPPSSLEGGER